MFSKKRVIPTLGVSRTLRDRRPKNAKCYGSKAFTELCEDRGIRQSFTRPYTPKTNGKAERFIQTLKRRWAYRYAYRTSAQRADSLRPWVAHYNHQRPHRALGKKTPMARLRDARQQRVWVPHLVHWREGHYESSTVCCDTYRLRYRLECARNQGNRAGVKRSDASV